MSKKFVDLFCGMGTIRMGFEQAGWECVYSVEWDKHKRRIYEVIFGREPEGCDIRELRGYQFPPSDCWTFGAPCQDFSITGTRAGLAGDKSGMVREVFRLLGEIKEECRPGQLLYENVKGMLSSNKGLDYLEILCEMDKLGYDLEWQVLDSKDFGIPQHRERVFTVGHLRGRGGRKIFPYTNTNPNNLKKLVDGHQTYRVYDPNGLGRTLMGEGGNLNDKAGQYLINNHIRRLSPREVMRLQGVPDHITDKLIAAGISDTQMYRAAGDATTVNVLYEIAKSLADNNVI